MKSQHISSFKFTSYLTFGFFSETRNLTRCATHVLEPEADSAFASLIVALVLSSPSPAFFLIIRSGDKSRLLDLKQPKRVCITFNVRRFSDKSKGYEVGMQAGIYQWGISINNRVGDKNKRLLPALDYFVISL